MAVDGDIKWMRRALELAAEAGEMGEVPVGAVICRNDELIAEGFNRRESDKNALAHAELLAIDEACKRLGGWRLPGCTLYVTLEPCPMCAGAIINSRIERVAYGASDPKAGCYGSLANFGEVAFNHQPTVVPGVLEEEAADLLRNFFSKLRKK